MICKYFDCESGARQPALFADFTICPTEPLKKGAAQPVTVKKIAHPRVVADWPATDSPRDFLDHFLGWYVPLASEDVTASSWPNVLKLIHWDLSPELARLLEADASAPSDRAVIVGLHFDPVLLTRHTGETYHVGEVTQHAGRYQAAIYGVIDGKRAEVPDVVAEFVREPDRWIFFVDFRYPSRRTDLLSLLKASRPR